MCPDRCPSSFLAAKGAASPASPRYLGRDLAVGAAEEGGFGREKAILEVFIQAAVAAAHGHGSRAEPGGLGGTDASPALTSPARRSSAAAPSAHPAQLFLLAGEPFPSLASPPAPASLRSMEGAELPARFGSVRFPPGSVRFAPLAAPGVPAQQRQQRQHRLPFLPSPRTAAARPLPLAEFVAPLAVLALARLGAVAAPWRGKTRSHGGMRGAPCLLQHPRELPRLHLRELGWWGCSSDPSGCQDHHKWVSVHPAGDFRAAGEIPAPSLRQL